MLERFDDDEGPYSGSAPYASERAVYKLAINDEDPVFDFSIHPIYRCPMTDEGLEQAAVRALKESIDDIRSQWANVLNHALKGHVPDVENLVVQINVPTRSDLEHVATFYCPFRIDPSASLDTDDFLLADISGVDLADVLTGIHSKSYLMAALDKLIIRWRLFNDQVLIAAPFVGHQWKSKSEKLEIWERLLRQLEAKRTVFLTRTATWSGYKSALQETGLDPEILASFGLEHQIVATGNKKQDFHAKVYIGIGEQCEVFSGSANLVDGPSMENATFAKMHHDKVLKKYVDPLKLTLPDAPERNSHHILIHQNDRGWVGTVGEGPAPQDRRID